MLEVKNIHKSYGNNRVLNGLDLKVNTGEIYGLIGSNGAGKTTLFNIIAQVLAYDEGKVLLNGENITSLNQLSQKVGYIIDIPATFEYMTAKEYLEFLSSAKKTSKEEVLQAIEHTLKLVGLENSINTQIKKFSRGMKQRMGIASGLIFNPDLILLDEPSSALDPQGRIEVLNIIQSLKNEGKTIILSTHILNDIEKICDRLGFLVNGKISLEGTLEEILDRFKADKISIYTTSENIAKLKDILKDFSFYEIKGGLLINYSDQNEKHTILDKITSSQINFQEISNRGKTLDQIYMIVNSGVDYEKI